MKFILCLYIFLLPLSLVGQNRDYIKFYNEGIAFYKEKEYEKFYSSIVEAGKLHPYHQGIFYVRAKAAALTGRKDEAIKFLTKALLINVGYPLEGVADFDGIKDSKEFGKLLALQKELAVPVVHSDTAFVIKDRTLHTEGIEYDDVHKLFYLGSIHKRKVVAVNASGVASDFCPPAENGMTSIFGIKADTKRNLLWVCSSPMQEMENYDSTAHSAVYKFDLTTRKLIAQYHRGKNDKDGVFGDLILSKQGDVYVSDSQNNILLKVNEKTQQLESFYSSPEFWNIQGLAFSPDESVLFISDYVKGVFRLTVNTKALSLLTPPENLSMKGIDGLYFYQNSLIGVQNGVSPNCAVRYHLNSGLTGITKSKVIDRGHPAFGEPTLGVLSGDTFYYIANSQWGGYDDDHRIKPEAQLQDIVILKYDLKSRP